MTSDEIRKKYLKYFESKGHKIIPSASLVPENDPSVLFTTAGMQQFKSYYIGKKNAQEDFGTLNTASVQKCVRTSDIDEAGDESHLTFFEMLGNFSFGGYWKEEAIKYAHEFITSPDWMNLKIDYVSIFAGEDDVPPDLESEKIWKGINPNITIKKFGRADNFWGPTGEEGPCGPTTEIYVDGIEIWNIVFNEFYQNIDKSLAPLKIKGIDTGMGLERLTMVAQNKKNVFDTDLLAPIMAITIPIYDIRSRRIIADHVRTAVFMIADGVIPSNSERGYVLRKLIRRAVNAVFNKEIKPEEIKTFIDISSIVYQSQYSEIKVKALQIETVINEEVKKYQNVISVGMEKVKKILSFLQAKHEKRREKFSGTIIKYEDLGYEKLTAKDIFDLYTREGVDVEIVLDYKKKYYVDIPEEPDIVSKFYDLMNEHKEISRGGMEQKFKGGLGGHSEMEIKYHTATHLLLAALRKVLGAEIVQKGSNITTERLRFDFNWPEKLSSEQLKAVEDLVNQKIKENIPVEMMELPKEKAIKIVTTLSFDLSKYGDVVKVYKIGSFSIEFCGGPHAENTGDLASIEGPESNSRDEKRKRKFKITKEEASSQGIRRIKAIIE